MNEQELRKRYSELMDAVSGGVNTFEQLKQLHEAAKIEWKLHDFSTERSEKRLNDD